MTLTEDYRLFALREEQQFSGYISCRSLMLQLAHGCLWVGRPFIEVAETCR